MLIMKKRDIYVMQQKQNTNKAEQAQLHLQQERTKNRSFVLFHLNLLNRHIDVKTGWERNMVQVHSSDGRLTAQNKFY
jgi:hypothetical protein